MCGGVVGARKSGAVGMYAGGARAVQRARAKLVRIPILRMSGTKIYARGTGGTGVDYVKKGVTDLDTLTDAPISKRNAMAVALMGLAYLAVTITFGVGGGMPGIGSAAAVTVGSNAATLPYYTLKAYIPTYNTTELTAGATNIGWNVYLTSTSYAASDSRVYPVWQAFWTLLVIMGFYLVPTALYYLYEGDLFADLTKEDKDKAHAATQDSLSHVTFFVAKLLVSVMIQINYIVFLGDTSKIASWLAAIVVAVQDSMYFAGTFLSSNGNDQTLSLVEKTLKNQFNIEVKLTVSTGMKISTFILSTFLWWILFGTCLLIPLLDKGGITAIDPAALRATLAFYMFQQTWAYAKFNFVNFFKESAIGKFFRHNLVTLLEHAGVFSLATVYVFEALASLYNAGRLN